MINSVEDLKDRALMESNTLKSLILYSSNGYRQPSRDDILIHDYQIANSVTMNQILSNYIVNLNYAGSLLLNSDTSSADKYFTVVKSIGEDDIAQLDGNTRLVLNVNDGDGSFQSMRLEYDVKQILPKDGTVEFVNLDSVWYGIVRTNRMEDTGDVDFRGDPIIEQVKDYLGEPITYDSLVIVDGMNDFLVNPNPFNGNPFADENTPLLNVELGEITFNEFIRQLCLKYNQTIKINCIVENMFQGNIFDETYVGGEPDPANLGQVISACRYIVCLTCGLYGLQMVYRKSGMVSKFVGMRLYDIGAISENLDPQQYAAGMEYEFIECGFHSIGEKNTMFIVFKEKNWSYPWWESSSSSFLTEYQVDVDESQDIYSTPAEIVGEKYHYVFLNDDSYDRAYGFSSIDSVVVDQMIVDPDKVFTKVETVKTLDTINIAMTNYGFWDIEPNETKNIVYSFRGDEKSHSYYDLERFNEHESKMLEPTAYEYDRESLLTEFPDKVVEYDKVWKLDDTERYYQCHYTGTVLTEEDEDHPDHVNSVGVADFPRYAKVVTGFDGKTYPFAGGTKSFAIYNSPGTLGWDQPYIFTSMNEHQARRLIFSSPTLVNPFIDWMYRQIVQQPLNDEETGASHDGLGEYFLYSKHSDIVGYLNSLIHSEGDHKRFSNLLYQIPGNDAVVTRFGSAQTIVGDDEGTMGLYDYCNELNVIMAREYNIPMDGLAWVLGLESASDAENQFKQTITQWFIQRRTGNQEAGDYLQHLEPFVNEVLSDLQKEFPQLSYFNPYLKTVLMHDLDISGFKSGSPVVQLVEDSIGDTVKSAQQFLDNQFQTAMVLGRYDSSKEGNSCYPGFDQYIYQNSINLGLSDVLDIMSPIETKNEVFSAIKAMEFFSQNNTYGSMSARIRQVHDFQLFKLTDNAEFVRKSGLVYTSSGDEGKYLNVNWDAVKNWLFYTITGIDVLKAFVRTQIYRPLFFKYNNYDNFSQDVSAYKCETKKTFVDHAGETKSLVFDENLDIDVGDSGLAGVAGEYDIENAKYYRQTNVLEYYINYSQILVKDNKFVHGDVEFYVIRPNGQDRVTSIYFNEFQNQVMHQNSEIEITDNKFVLNGVEYSMADGRISIDSAPDGFTGDLAKFSQEIVDGKFNIDGVWYVLESEDGEYVKAKLADLQDNAMKQILVTPEGYGEYRPLGISFQFVEVNGVIDWNIVQITRKFQTAVMDSIVSEWCKFDDAGVEELTDDKTFEWYIANELVDIESRYPSLKTNVINLDDVLYNGHLLDVECTLSLSNEVSGGGVLTKGVLRKSAIGSDDAKTQDIGILFGNDLNPVSTKVFTGTIENGLVTEDQAGGQTFILKDPLGGKNNCNCAWMSAGTWNSCWHVDVAGTVSEDTETKKLVATFNDNVENVPECIILAPILVSEESTEVFSYRVTTKNDDSGSYIVNKNDNTVHVVANGDRYVIDLQTGSLQKLVFMPVPVNTMDFSTQYGADHLLDNLLVNIKQYMMNDIVQKILVNGQSQQIDIVPERDLKLYLDLFTDYSSLEHFKLAQRQRTVLSEEKQKFQSIFKNNLTDIDESGIYIGKIYAYLQRKVQDTFGDGESIVLVQKPSISAVRTGNTDTFSYDVRFDLNLKAKKSVLEKNKNSEGESYTISNATMKDVECKVTLVPEFKQGDASPMKYRIQYHFPDGTYEVVYDQISYTYEGVIKTKAVKPKTVLYHLHVSNPPTSNANPILAMTNPNEFVSAKVKNVFDSLKNDIIKDVNNSIHELDQAEGDETIESIQLLNEGIGGRIWNLGVPLGDSIDASQIKFIYINYGRTMIDGKLYDVSDDSGTLDEFGGSSSYRIINEPAHIDSQNLDIMESIWAAISSEPIVTQQYLSTNFNVFELDGWKYLEFKNPGLQSIGLREEVVSYDDINYSDISDIGKYWTSLGFLPNKHESDSFSVWMIPSESSAENQQTDIETDVSADSSSDTPDDNIIDPNAVGPDLSTESMFSISLMDQAERAWQTYAAELGLTTTDPTYETKYDNFMNGTGASIRIANDSSGTTYSFEIYLQDDNGESDDDTSLDSSSDEGSDESSDESENLTGQLMGEQEESDIEIDITGFEEEKEELSETSEDKKEEDNQKRYWLKGQVNVTVKKLGFEKYELELENSRATIGFVAPPFEDDPQKRYYTDTQEYEITGLSGIEFEFQERAEGASESVERVLNQVLFKVSVKYRKCDALLKPTGDSEYVAGIYHVTSTSLANVIRITDLNEKSSLGFDYGCAYCPDNISTEVVANLQSIDDLNYRSLYFKFDSNGDFASGGSYCPCRLNVLEYEKNMENEGDIFDRYYESEQTIVARSAKIETIDDDDTWVDATATVKSIRSVESDDTWKKLIWTNGHDDEVVPEKMREKVTDLVSGKLRLTDEYFSMVMQQFQTFLGLIQTELTRHIDASQLSNIFQFKYNADVKYALHTQDNSKWNKSGDTVEQSGLFSLDHSGTEYKECLRLFNDHLYNQFYSDYSQLDKVSGVDISKRDYGLILQSVVSKDQPSLAHYINRDYRINSASDIYTIRGDLFKVLYENLNGSVSSDADIVEDVYGKWGLVDFVKLINAIRTTMNGTIVEMVVSDGYCNIFTQLGTSIIWYRMDAGQEHIDFLLDNKIMSGGSDYQYNPTIQQLQYPIDPNGDWIARTLNRDFSRLDKTNIQDSIAVLCQGLDQNGNSFPLWYLSNLDVYVKCNSWEKIVDMAYEQKGDSLYVLFKGDNHVYRFDSILDLRDLNDIVLLQKENATMKIATLHSVLTTDKQIQYDYIYLNYYDNLKNPDDLNSVNAIDPKKWEIKLFGNAGRHIDCEVWGGSPGKKYDHFRQYNTILFGDSLFNEEQLRFQNISKNKDMYDILDVDEVDGCYYGLFRDESTETLEKNLGYDTYIVFKTQSRQSQNLTGITEWNMDQDVSSHVERENMPVQRLNYNIISPHLYRSADGLYSLYVLAKVEDDSYPEGYRVRFQEISVPDSEVYSDRRIEIQNLLASSDQVDMTGGLHVNEVIMSSFKPMCLGSSFFVLSDKGFHKILCTNPLKQMSIDNLEGEGGLKDALKKSLFGSIMQKHLDERHGGDQAYYFDVLAQKVNQFESGFNVFSFVPAEFSYTQDIGVIPDSKIDDTDALKDHRVDSVYATTDILWQGGMAIDADTNPGIITAAVSNPATTYDSARVFSKSQRNPSIQSTEFYDYIYDSDGNVLMDLYSIPFIYRINSNNTYDLYINVPTTRSKYLNRVAGSLNADLTTQVKSGDTRTRRNFLNQRLVNNLDESTTRLRIYIDKKYISIGNVEQVEISGNSIPLEIYRDAVNNGNYDSIALESRWDGNVVDVYDNGNDINKVMLEFECYGTDSQSIHIQGKTLINHVLDDKKYKYA